MNASRLICWECTHDKQVMDSRWDQIEPTKDDSYNSIVVQLQHSEKRHRKLLIGDCFSVKLLEIFSEFMLQLVFDFGVTVPKNVSTTLY